MRHEYEEKDIQEILNRAVRADVIRQTGREALLMNARELGISDEALAQAELEYLREKTRSEEKRANFWPSGAEATGNTWPLTSS